MHELDLLISFHCSLQNRRIFKHFIQDNSLDYLSLVYNRRYWGHSDRFGGASVKCKTCEGLGKKENSTRRQLIVLCLPDVHLEKESLLVDLVRCVIYACDGSS